VVMIFLILDIKNRLFNLAIEEDEEDIS